MVGGHSAGAHVAFRSATGRCERAASVGDEDCCRAEDDRAAAASRAHRGWQSGFRACSVVTELEDEPGRLHITWRVILRDGSNYVRQEVTVTAKAVDVPVREVRMVDFQVPYARVLGTVKGSPVVAGLLFAGFEDPLSSCAVAGDRSRCWIERELPLKAGQAVTYSSVAGVDYGRAVAPQAFCITLSASARIPIARF